MSHLPSSVSPSLSRLARHRPASHRTAHATSSYALEQRSTTEPATSPRHHSIARPICSSSTPSASRSIELPSSVATLHNALPKRSILYNESSITHRAQLRAVESQPSSVLSTIADFYPSFIPPRSETLLRHANDKAIRVLNEILPKPSVQKPAPGLRDTCTCSKTLIPSPQRM